MTARKRFRGKVVYTGGIVSQRTNFQQKIDPGSPVTTPGGGGGAGGLAWDPDAINVARANTRVWLSNGHAATWKAFGAGESIYLGNAIGAESITYSATGLPAGLSINSSTGQLTGTASPVGYNQVTVTASDGSNEITKTVYILQRSQQEYTTVGTFTLTLPNYVDKVHAVCVGGGGAGSQGPGSPNRAAEGGGAGGGLRWIQDLPVSNNEELTIVVGAGGQTEKVPPSSYIGLPGGPSKIVRAAGTPGETTLLEAEGGGGGEGQISPAPESLVYGGRGTPFGVKSTLGGALVGGGNGGDNRWNLFTSAGGGSGAGGYEGDGGRASNASPLGPTYPANSPTFGVNQGNLRSEHGRGGGGSGAGRSPATGGGGGVGIWGMTGHGAMSPNSITHAPPNQFRLSIPSTVAPLDPWMDNTETASYRKDIGWNSPNYTKPAIYNLPAPAKGGDVVGWSGSYGYHAKFRSAPVWGPIAGLGPTGFFGYSNPPSFVSSGYEGGLFGGGGGGFVPMASNENAQGGRGAVRVIWGDDRAWPSRNTGDQ